MKYLKGHHSRVINPPGYHIHPKYDLHFFRHKRHKSHKKPFNDSLNLTAMIDMFSILVVFLIMNFSSTGEIFFISKDIKLPEANHARPIDNAPLISIVGNTITLEAEKLGENPVYLEEKDVNLPRLKSKLQQMRIMAEAVSPGQPFKGQVNVQADVNTPVVYIKRVMNTLISEGWTGVNFAVQGADGSTPPEGN